MAMNLEGARNLAAGRFGWDDDAVRERMVSQDASLVAQLVDERYRNGVSGGPGSTDLEFIQMTGLTRFAASDGALDAQSARSTPETVWVRGPWSFQLSGMDDVVQAGGPPPLGEAVEPPSTSSKAFSSVVPPRSAEALRELIADLTPKSPAAVPETLRAMADDMLDTHDSARPDKEVWPEGEVAVPDREEAQASLLEGSDGVAGSGVETDLSESDDTASLSALGERPALDRLLEKLSGDQCSGPESEGEAPPLPGQESPDGMVSQETEMPPRPRAASAGEAGPNRPMLNPEGQLLEAEELLLELEQQAREVIGVSAGWDEVFTPGTPPFSGGNPASPDTTGAQRYSRRVTRRMRLLRWALLLMILAALAAAVAYVCVRFAAPGLQPAAALYAEASEFLSREAYEEAAARYQLFVERFPGDPRRPEAQFQAAVACFAMRPAAEAAARDCARRALALFGAFAESNPGHPRTARAGCLMGILHYRLAEYADAIACLRPLCESNRRGEDPEMVLPAVRTLARAYARTGDYERAVETYLAAASLSGNPTPETDLDELAGLCMDRALAEPDPAVKRQWSEKAALYWDRAASAPGIDPQSRRRMRARWNALLDKMDAGAQDRAGGAAGGE